MPVKMISGWNGYKELMPLHTDDPMKAAHHLVHDYANFISSAAMVLGEDTIGVILTAPANTHVAHAFYLNSRKLADFFQKKSNAYKRDVLAKHFISGFQDALPEYEALRDTMNRQLAHIS